MAKSVTTSMRVQALAKTYLNDLHDAGFSNREIARELTLRIGEAGGRQPTRPGGASPKVAHTTIDRWEFDDVKPSRFLFSHLKAIHRDLPSKHSRVIHLCNFDNRSAGVPAVHSPRISSIIDLNSLLPELPNRMRVRGKVDLDTVHIIAVRAEVPGIEAATFKWLNSGGSVYIVLRSPDNVTTTREIGEHVFPPNVGSELAKVQPLIRNARDCVESGRSATESVRFTNLRFFSREKMLEISLNALARGARRLEWVIDRESDVHDGTIGVIAELKALALASGRPFEAVASFHDESILASSLYQLVGRADRLVLYIADSVDRSGVQEFVEFSLNSSKSVDLITEISGADTGVVPNSSPRRYACP